MAEKQGRNGFDISRFVFNCETQSVLQHIPGHCSDPENIPESFRLLRPLHLSIEASWVHSITID